jgi:1,2-diacylglycerol 3-alpha-glucosyltransferase
MSARIAGAILADEPVRALLISDVYFPRVNGVSTSLATFRRDLPECGVTTTLVAPAYPQAQPSASGGAEEGLVRVPSAAIPRDPEDRRMRWNALSQALAALARERFDVVHIQTPFVAHYAGVRFARRAGLPCVATYHTFFEEYLHHYVPALPHGAGRLLARAFTRSQCRQVNALIAPSEPMRVLLAEYGVRTPIHVLPTGLPAECFRPGDGARFRAAQGLPPDRPIVLYVGRVAHEKNIEFLIRMFERLHARMPRLLLVIAGEGPARKSLGQLAERLGLAEHVCFVGYLERAHALLDCYAAARAFVFASRTETQGLVLLEAMAQGIPVVSTAELGTRSVLQPASGALVVREDLGEFAAAVQRLLSDDELRKSSSVRARTYAQTWSSQAMAQRLAALYREVCVGDPAAAAPASAPPSSAPPSLRQG